MATISVDDLDSNFKLELAKRLGGNNIKRCFACGTCTASCPVSKVVKGFDPRKMIHKILLGCKKELLSSDMIWYCSLCNTCSFVCPQDVRFSEAMIILRRMAVENGYVNPLFADKWRDIEKQSQNLRSEILTSLIASKDNATNVNFESLLKDAQHTGGK